MPVSDGPFNNGNNGQTTVILRARKLELYLSVKEKPQYKPCTSIINVPF
jgi:hypothetical protein